MPNGFQIYVVTNSSGGRVRVPAGATYAKPGSFAKGGTRAYRLALRDANREMALEQQALVVETLRPRIMRRNVSSGRLLAVTGDPRNRYYTEFGYGVGDEDFLDGSIAKYWRQIEEGYSGHVGRTIHGLWGANIGRVSGDRVWAAGPWSRHSPRRSDMFLPATGFRQGGRFASREFDEDGERRKAPNFAKTTTIKNPIEAKNYYADAFQKFNAGQRAVEAAHDALSGLSVGLWTARMQRRGRLW